MNLILKLLRVQGYKLYGYSVTGAYCMDFGIVVAKDPDTAFKIASGIDNSSIASRDVSHLTYDIFELPQLEPNMAINIGGKDYYNEVMEA